MIKLYGALCGEDLASLRSELPEQWLQAWDAHHKIGKNEKAARLSLTALCLLHRAGANGTLAYEACGRPFFADRLCDFSITHTQNHAFCALTDRGNKEVRIGLDAEDLDRADLSRTDEMAARWFLPNEQAVFAASPTKETFLRIWTRKEAYVKCTGEGLRSMREIDTEVIKNAGRMRFFEQKSGNILITLCAPIDENPPKEIQIIEKE